MAAEGQSGWDVGVARARRETGSFSYRNAIMIEADGAPAGCLIGDAIPEEVEADLSGFSPAGASTAGTGEPCAWYMVRECAGCTSAAPRAGPRRQASGTGGQDWARREGSRYERHCRRREHGRPQALPALWLEAATRAMVKNGWSVGSDNWLLMTREFWTRGIPGQSQLKSLQVRSCSQSWGVRSSWLHGGSRVGRNAILSLAVGLLRAVTNTKVRSSGNPKTTKKSLNN